MAATIAVVIGSLLSAFIIGAIEFTVVWAYTVF
jgi:hypothetical protein